MTNSKHSIPARLLSVLCAVVLLAGCVLTWSPAASAATESSKDLRGILAEVAASGAAGIRNGAGQVVASAELMWGTPVDDEKALAAAGGAVSNEDGSVKIDNSNWNGVGFVKLTVKQDTTLRFVNAAFTHGGWYSWTTVSLLKVTDGVKKSVFSTVEVNPNGESGIKNSWDEGKWFDYTMSVKAGDVLYLNVNGNKWGALLPADMLRIEVVSGDATGGLRENATAGMMIYNVAQAQGQMVENNGLTSYNIKTGTIDNLKDFDAFAENRLALGAQSYITPTEMRVEQNRSIIYQVQIEKDCQFRFTHPSAPRGSWAAGYTVVQVFRTTDNGTEMLKETKISNLEVPENYYTPDVYEAKAGETYYMVYRTTDSYYGATTLSMGYEAAEKLDLTPKTEEIAVGTALQEGKLNGQLVSISFAEKVGANYLEMKPAADGYASSSGAKFTATSVTVPTGKKAYVVIKALADIRLDLVGTGVDKLVLADGTEFTKAAHLAAGDCAYAEFGEGAERAYALNVSADRTMYVSGARHTGATKESYDLYDMINQMAFRGESEGANLRMLSTFRIESGRLNGNRSNVLCSDIANGKFVSREGGANTGLQPIWFGNSMGIKLVADTGYDTIITVTATQDARISMTFPVISQNPNWALGTYVRCLVMDTDGTTVELYNKIVPELAHAEYFLAEAQLKAGQSLVVDYYTPTGLYGTVDFLPTFTLETEAFDASQVTDFTEAAALREHMQAGFVTLQDHVAALDEALYSGEMWLEMENLLQEGIDALSNAKSKAEMDALVVNYKAKLDAVMTMTEEAEYLKALKAEKLQQLDVYMSKLDKKYYTKSAWEQIQKLYESGKANIEKQNSETKIKNALNSTYNGIEKVEMTAPNYTTSILVSAGVGAAIIAAGVVAYVLLTRKKEEKTDSE